MNYKYSISTVLGSEPSSKYSWSTVLDFSPVLTHLTHTNLHLHLHTYTYIYLPLYTYLPYTLSLYISTSDTYYGGVHPSAYNRVSHLTTMYAMKSAGVYLSPISPPHNSVNNYFLSRVIPNNRITIFNFLITKLQYILFHIIFHVNRFFFQHMNGICLYLCNSNMHSI